MGFAKLNVWISEKDPCTISTDNWSVIVSGCGGQPLSWCDIKSPFGAPCGHADIQLPPGCYVVSAVRWVIIGTSLFPVFTDSCVVTVGCDQSACVHLFRRTDRQHLHSAEQAATRLAEEQIIPRDKAERLREAVNAVVEHLPKTALDFELERQLEQLSKMVELKPEEGKHTSG